MKASAFVQLVGTLRDEGYPTWTVYDSRTDPWWQARILDFERDRAEWNSGRRPIEPKFREPYCDGAWMIEPIEGGWQIRKGWGNKRTAHIFASEEQACGALYELVTGEYNSGVRLVGAEELSPGIRMFLSLTDSEPEETRLGDVLVAQGQGGMAFRLIETRDGFNLDNPSLGPPAIGEQWLHATSLDDACKILVAAVGNSLPILLGVPRWGVDYPHSSELRTALLDRWRNISADDVVEAYLGAPDHVLDYREPTGLQLLTPGLVALAKRAKFSVGYGESSNSISLTDGSVDYGIQHDSSEYKVVHRPERANGVEVLATESTLGAAQAVLGQILRSHATDWSA